MKQYSWTMVSLALCLQCSGGQKTDTSEPPAPTSEETAAPEESAPTTEEPAPTSEEPAPTSEAPAPSAAPSGSAAASSKPCDGLTKTKCKITKGCAWNDIKKCVEEEGGP